MKIIIETGESTDSKLKQLNAKIDQVKIRCQTQTNRLEGLQGRKEDTLKEIIREVE
jgi:capsule polysaccharide export protein KpsE/RkpR